MAAISLRPLDPGRDFDRLAEWFSNIEGDPNTAEDLKTYYQGAVDRITQQVAERDESDLLGFYWAVRNQADPQLAYLYLYVKPEVRRQGIGNQLLMDMLSKIRSTGIKKIRTSVDETCPDCKSFTEKRGFHERSHGIAMLLDLVSFDDRPYDILINQLTSEGFQFTSMEALGNTEEAQRKLYNLNETTGMDDPGSGGEPSWSSFEDFQKRVCQADWYKPGGQKVVIDTRTGEFVAMSAITVFEGSDHAYNLHTGTDRNYRGKKLAQAVKVTALRYARNVLKTEKVLTHHNSLNIPMIAIDQKLGYQPIPGYYSMQLDLEP